MPQVPTITSQAKLETDRLSKPKPRFDDAQARALAGLGSAVSGLGNVLARRECNIARMKAKSGLNGLQRLGQEIIEAFFENIHVAGQEFLD
ncbi:hypothetical protein [Nitratireductor sp. XY-223]|uniref:hypothetical protein n=1 Tax=Nitratireductor sp. XY-223 TaxID=2561926 RepID=UPI0010AA2E00|nr:hypothetical protein [Nitratireductor sp. XY-223]